MLGYYTKSPLPISCLTCLPTASLSMHSIERKERGEHGHVCRGQFLEDFQQESSVWPDTGLRSRSRHRARALPLSPRQRLPVISSPHLAAPGVPPSITGHCLRSTQPPPLPPAQWLLVNNPVCSHPQKRSDSGPFSSQTPSIHQLRAPRAWLGK